MGEGKKSLPGTRVCVPDHFDQAVMADHVRRSRAEQGFPPTISDPELLEKVAALLTDGVAYWQGEAQTRQ